MPSILIVEDNKDYAATLETNLVHEGYDVVVAHDGSDGLARVRSDAFDLVVLDLMLPAMSGYTVLQRLRDEGRGVPVLLLTALGTEEDKLRGFGLGADDYVVKPVGLRELLARVKALLRRGGAAPASNEAQVGDLTIDFGARTVRRGESEIVLRPKEFDLLAALVRHRGRVVSRGELLRDVFGYSAGAESRTVETHVAALRDRLGPNDYIVTVRGAGYRIAGD